MWHFTNATLVIHTTRVETRNISTLPCLQAWYYKKWLMNVFLGNWKKLKIANWTNTFFSFSRPDAKITNIKVDIVGLLRCSKGCVYIMSNIDRIPCWPHAIAIKYISSAKLTSTIVSGWISIFRVHSMLTTVSVYII